MGDSSVTSSSFRSELVFLECDHGVPPQSEIEEIPSFRWLSPSFSRLPGARRDQDGGGDPGVRGDVSDHGGDGSSHRLPLAEGEAGPLLQLVKEGQESAARAIGLLCRDRESVDQMVRAGLPSVFATVLTEGPMKVKAMVAWAISELAAHSPICRKLFAQEVFLFFLIRYLALDTTFPHSNSAAELQIALSGGSHQEEDTSRRLDDPATEAPSMKAMAARALWQLAKGDRATCRSIVKTRALFFLAILMEEGSDEARYNSAMALMEIAQVAEEDADLRWLAFKPNSPAGMAVVDQMLRVVERGDSGDLLLLPCVTAIGCLSRTFRAAETRDVIGPLVRLFDPRRGAHGSRAAAAAAALTQSAWFDNYLNMEHYKVLLPAGRVQLLVQLVYHEGQADVRLEALVLLCWLAHNVPGDKELDKAGALKALKWASEQGFVVQDQSVKELLAMSRGLKDPATKASSMKAMAARALWHLAKGDRTTCRNIVETRALFFLAILMEEGSDKARYNSAMALMEIARVAAEDADLRRSAFKPNLPAGRAVVDRMLRVVKRGDSGDPLLLPCVTAIGNLSSTFPAAETWDVIEPLVRLLDREAHLSRASVVALTKFASSDNFLLQRSRAIVASGGAQHLVQLVLFGEPAARRRSWKWRGRSWRWLGRPSRASWRLTTP